MKFSIPFIKARRKNTEAGPSIQPYRDWVIALCLAAVLLVGALAWSTELFFRVKSESEAAAAPVATPKLFDDKALSDTVSFYKQRQAGFDNPSPSPQFLVDPSI